MTHTLISFLPTPMFAGSASCKGEAENSTGRREKGGGEGAPALGQLPGEQKEEKERLQTLAPCVPLILTVGRHRQDLELSTHWLLLPLPPGKQWAW